MRCFKIPLTRLDLFLVSLRMNYTKVYEVEFIFQFLDHYDVVILELIAKDDELEIEKFIGKIWASALTDAKAIPKLPFKK